MTNEDKNKILELRNKGYDYKSIANQLNLPLPSVTSFCRRNELSAKDNKNCCKNCGAKLVQTSGHRQKTSCSDKCRRVWWKNNPNNHKLTLFKENVCCTCKRMFISYSNRVRKYCSVDCYKKARQVRICCGE